MFYIVFTEYDIVKQPIGGAYTPPPVCRYVGSDKQSALNGFTNNIHHAFSTNSHYSGRTYFVCFDADLDIVKTLKEKKDVWGILPAEITQSDILLIKQNFDIAICTHVLRHSVHRFAKSVTAIQCDCCKAETALLKNAYGQYLCTDCWNDYLTTERGQVEYVIGATSGEYKGEAFSHIDRRYITNAWNEHSDELGKTAAELEAIEKAAEDAGIIIKAST